MGEHKRYYISEYQHLRFAVPEYEEQQAIATVLSKADDEIKSLEQKLSVLKDQKKFLLNNMVTGTIRLPRFVSQKRSVA
ncbi:MAG: hypothetical protein L6420_08370 [Elusimicrobia bacterium]|nr:hypothetical protein [Elusimicrobiota bacterium]